MNILANWKKDHSTPLPHEKPWPCDPSLVSPSYCMSDGEGRKLGGALDSARHGAGGSQAHGGHRARGRACRGYVGAGA